MAETTIVRPGQAWADNDKRVKGRTLRVLRLYETRALCETVTNDDATQQRIDRGDRTARDMRGKTTSISLDRFRPTSTGYRLVQDVED